MAKYLKINGQVCLDTLPSMSRPFFHSFVLCLLPISQQNSFPQQSSFLQLLSFYCRFNQASILLFLAYVLSYVLPSFSARCAFVNSWRNTSAERVLNVRSTKRKSENHYLYTCELI